jgi:predicted TIM-barrel fold metal-dependent hydrolase
VTTRLPDLVKYADDRDVGKAAKDWPQLNFIIYHSGFRFTGGTFAQGWEQFEKTGRVDWVTDLAEIPEKFGVRNVYGDLGQIFAQSTIAEPRLCAAMMGQLVKGLGADHICWGTDAVWTGAPQWQIEALRRLEIPAEMQKKYGFAPLGPADGPVKRQIFGENSARLYKYDRRAELATDRIALAKTDYEKSGDGRTNRRYGYIARPTA